MLINDTREPKLKEILMLSDITGNIPLDMLIKDLVHEELKRIECRKIESNMYPEQRYQLFNRRVVTGGVFK